MRFVRSAVRRPHRCAAIPFVGMNDPEGFIDTDTEFEGERVYVSVKAVKQMVQLIGWPSKAQYARLEADAKELLGRAARAEADLEEARKQLEAVGVLKAAGYTAQRKPGRKPQEKAVA